MYPINTFQRKCYYFSQFYRCESWNVWPAITQLVHSRVGSPTWVYLQWFKQNAREGWEGEKCLPDVRYLIHLSPWRLRNLSRVLIYFSFSTFYQCASVIWLGYLFMWTKKLNHFFNSVDLSADGWTIIKQFPLSGHLDYFWIFTITYSASIVYLLIYIFLHICSAISGR